jgi:arabinofuranosyltransferase
VAVQIVLYLAFIIYVGGDQLVMKRFFVPLLPAIYLLSLRGVSELFFQPADAERIRFGRRIIFSAAVAVAIFIVLLPSFAGSEHNRIFKAEKPADADRKEAGEWLKQNVEPDATIALVPAGIIPYYSGLRTIDLVGLNDARIAHSSVPGFGKGAAGHEKYNSAYVLERRPALIFLGACRIWPQKFSAESLLNYYWMYGGLVPGNREILRLDEFKKDYAPCAVRVGEGYLHFFKRNDFPLPPAEPLAATVGTG